MRAWKRSGVAQPWLGVARRGASSSRFVSRISTLERKTPKASLSFPRRARITRGGDLQRIVREGKRIRTVHIEVRVAASPLARSSGDEKYTGTRVGLIVPRFKHSAVARNQLKRRLRELVRLQILPAQLEADLVLRIRPEAYQASFNRLATDIERAMTQLRQHVGAERPE